MTTLDRPVTLRCARCRRVLHTVTEAPDDWCGVLTVVRCRHCYLKFRRNFHAHVRRYEWTTHPDPERNDTLNMPLALDVPWSEVRRAVAEAGPNRDGVLSIRDPFDA